MRAIVSTSKHDKTEGDSPFPDDLERDPGIGRSGGASAMTGADPEELEADNTEEGDVENGAGPSGEARAGDLGRTNK